MRATQLQFPFLSSLKITVTRVIIKLSSPFTRKAIKQEVSAFSGKKSSLRRHSLFYLLYSKIAELGLVALIFFAKMHNHVLFAPPTDEILIELSN